MINTKDINNFEDISNFDNLYLYIKEVAKVEGATRWEVFWFVTLPMMLRTMMLVIIFTVIELVSSGTNTVVSKGYAQFGAMEYGVGSAMLWFYFMVVGLFLALFFFVYNRVFVKKWG